MYNLLAGYPFPAPTDRFKYDQLYYMMTNYLQYWPLPQYELSAYDLSSSTRRSKIFSMFVTPNTTYGTLTNAIWTMVQLAIPRRTPLGGMGFAPRTPWDFEYKFSV